ncbi:DUF3795 domain-containing protein [Christensenellaceae bacterium OttesenSCG-928-L17]|nr:DUF3795 domain-containing protein [Christensenellaceae bacterium OttesenSCG-928-L17]
MKQDLIAPCGVNCAVCSAYQQEENKCNGCRSDEIPPSPQCERCFIRGCERIETFYLHHCYECARFPCLRYRLRDLQFRKNIRVSPLRNLQFIRDKGMDAFLEREEKRWNCIRCGEPRSMQNKACTSCGHVRGSANNETAE